jgi:hypothetical protein
MSSDPFTSQVPESPCQLCHTRSPNCQCSRLERTSPPCQTVLNPKQQHPTLTLPGISQSMHKRQLTSPARALTQTDILRTPKGIQIPLRIELDASGGVDEGGCGKREQGEECGELVHCSDILLIFATQRGEYECERQRARTKERGKIKRIENSQ